MKSLPLRRRQHEHDEGHLVWDQRQIPGNTGPTSHELRILEDDPHPETLGGRLTSQRSWKTTHDRRTSGDDPMFIPMNTHYHISGKEVGGGGQASSIKDPRLYKAKVHNSKPLNSALFPRNRILTLASKSSKPTPHWCSLSLPLSLFLQVPIVTLGATVTIW